MNLFTFASDMPGKLADEARFKLRWSQNDVTSVHVPTNARGRAIATDTKFYHVAKLYKDYHESRKGFIGYLEDGSIAAEIRDTAETQICIASKDKKGVWQFKAGVMDDKKVIHRYEDTRKGTLLLLALMEEILKDTEARDTLTSMEKYLAISADAADWDYGNTAEEFSKLLCKFSNNAYYRVTKASDSFAPISCNTDNIKVLRSADLKNAVLRTGIVGFSENFVPKVEQKGKGISVVAGSYAIPGQKIEEKDKVLIPQMPDYYKVPKWVESSCCAIKESSDFAQPFRNILLTGPSGTGKTTGVKAMAALMGLPYTKITCNPDTDIFDLVGQMLPNTKEESNASDVFSFLDIPSFDDVENDFENTYRKLFGKEPDKMAAPSDCYEKIMELVLQNNQKGDKKDFVYVESDLIKAYRYGYFCEIQEPTVLKRSAVLVGLNSLLENDSCYTLPTGEVIKRHPNCVICLTTNSDYDGCNMIQQSVLSRMDIVREVPNPLASELRDRTMAQTGFTDEARLMQMSEMIEKINEFCKEKDITDGICGPRELSNWAKMAMVIAKVQGEKISNAIVCQAAFTTLINKVSQVKEDAEAVVSGCLALTYSSNDIEEGRGNYENGFL